MHPHRSPLWLSLVLALALPIDSVMTIAQTSQAAEVNPIGQTKESQEAEANRLLKQGIQESQARQFKAALQSWQQARDLYRAVKNHKGEGAALGNLGITYQAIGNYAKAIDYLQQWLTVIAQLGLDKMGEIARVE
jgi:tetratricopeptide (TPR) repeat protein